MISSFGKGVWLSLAFSIHFQTLAAYYTSAPTDPTATIDIGVLHGTSTVLPSATVAVNKFLGVPFAKSPPERFGPPVAPAPLRSPLLAQAWKPACIQQFKGGATTRKFVEGLFNPSSPQESEDCLYLNIYAPASTAPPKGRPVMFWIYGGSLQFGTAGQPEYDGSAFAAFEEVVIVAANYRTNVFGFPNSHELSPYNQNLGFQDQHFALEWVQRNIHAFGGDPEKVTIFGESAGGRSVDTLLTAPDFTRPGADPPFRAAILESGQNSYIGIPRVVNGTASFIALAKALNCTESKQSLHCVRKAPVAAIKRIVDNGMAFNFGPVSDGRTVTRSAEARDKGLFVKVPVLGGNNLNDGTAFVYGLTNLSAYLDATLGSTAPQSIPKVKAQFPLTNSSDPVENAKVIATIESLLQFQCPQGLWANQSHARGVPVWRYLYNVTFPNNAPLNGSLGVWHSSEIALVFQTFAGGPVNKITKKPTGLIPTNVAPTEFEKSLGRQLNRAWAAFARNPIDGPGWLGLRQKSRFAVAILGAHDTAYRKLVSSTQLDSQCKVFLPQIEALSGAAYGLL